MKKEEVVTLEDARVYLREHFEVGCKCLACGQRVKLYNRKINTGMALFLIGLYRLTVKAGPSKETAYPCFQNSEVMLEMDINTSSLDYFVLRHFGLMETMISDDPALKSSGKWRITRDGFRFVVGTLTVPESVKLYNNKVIGFSKEHCNIIQALKNKFDYRDFLLTPVPVIK